MNLQLQNNDYSFFKILKGQGLDFYNMNIVIDKARMRCMQK